MLKQTIDRLLSEQDQAKLADNPLVKHVKKRYPQYDSLPFIETQLVLKGGYSMAGVLTALPDGPMLCVTVAQTPDRKVVFAEHYFADSELQTIVVGQIVEAPMVQPVRNGNGPLIVGH